MTRRKRAPLKIRGALGRARLNQATLAAMIEEATVDAHDELEQGTGWFTMLDEHLELPFETRVLGTVVTVASIDLCDSGQLNAICQHGPESQAISLAELPLPTLGPAGIEWVEAYCHWLGRRPKFVTVHSEKRKAPAEPGLSHLLPDVDSNHGHGD